MEEFDKIKYLNKLNESPILALRYLSETAPNYLFKFFSLSEDEDLNNKKFDTLENNCIWFTTFDSMNDPFEFKGLYVNEQELQNRKSFYDMPEALVKIDKKYAVDSKTKKKKYDNYLKRFRDVFKFASFSATFNNNSMWAYYANSYKGFCCQYELISKELKDMLSLRPVFYEQQLKLIHSDFIDKLIYDGINSLSEDDSVVAQNIFNNLEYLKLFASIKDPSWENEKEYRCFYQSDNVGGLSVSCSEVNLKLVKIIAGPFCSKKNKDKLKIIAKKLGVDFKEGIVSETEFKLELK